MSKKPKKIEARLGQNEYHPQGHPHNPEWEGTDFVHVRQGDEHVRLTMAHPKESPLVESHPNHNEEWIPGTGTFEGREQYQHTLWDKPRGSAQKPEITGLFATPGAKNLVGTAIGLAVEHSSKRFGQIPTGSRDLSRESLPMVEKLNKKLKERGLEESPTPWRPSNEIIQGPENADGVRLNGANAFQNDWYKKVPDKEIGSANHLIRGLYAGRHLNQAQFHQAELPF